MFQLTDAYDVVRAFYDKMGMTRPAVPTVIRADRRSQLMAYLMSEVIEFGNATDLKDQVDAATDLLYFVMDLFVELGVDPAVPFSIVHEANMQKVHEDGKAHFDYSRVPPRMIKPDGWQAPEPQIHAWLEEARSVASVVSEQSNYQSMIDRYLGLFGGVDE